MSDIGTSSGILPILPPVKHFSSVLMLASLHPKRDNMSRPKFGEGVFQALGVFAILSYSSCGAGRVTAYDIVIARGRSAFSARQILEAIPDLWIRLLRGVALFETPGETRSFALFSEGRCHGKAVRHE